MEAIQVKCRHPKPNTRKVVKIKTTLYDLMETVIDVVGSDDKKMVKDVTVNILAKAKPKVFVTSH